MATKAGFEVTNAGGVMQVTQDYRNLLLIASNQFTMPARPPNSPWDDRWYRHLIENVPVMSSAAIMVLRVNGDPGVRLSTGSYRDGRKFVNFGSLWAATVTFQYYIFDMVPPANNKYGLQVFKEDGTLAFDALDYPFKMIDVATVTEAKAGGVGGGNGLIYTAPHTRVAAGCLGGGYYLSESQWDAYAYSMYTFWSGNNFHATLVHDPNPGGSGLPDGGYGQITQQVAIVDVTNLPLTYRRN